MLSLIYQKLAKISRFQLTITPSKIHSLQTPSPKSNSKPKNPPPPSSSLIQCLINSYGLSPETALLTAKRVDFRTPKDPTKLLFFFKSIGFSETHIGNMVSKRPRLLFSHPESTLLPKIQFFKQMGISDSDLIEFLVSQPDIFASSLEKCIRPSFDLSCTLFERDEIVKGLSQYRLFRPNFNHTLMPNVISLKDYGVPDSRILKFFMKYNLLANSERFRNNVEKIKNLGFNPSTHKFMEGVHVMMAMSTLTWDAKFEVYKSFGWSEDEVYRAFRSHPSCLAFSEKKITKGLNFFMKELGWDSSKISSYPLLLSYNLEKRSVPRYEVLQILFSKGLIKESEQKHAIKYKMSEKKFLKDYVIKYQEIVPEILKAFPHNIVLLKGDIKDKKKFVRFNSRNLTLFASPTP